MTELQAEQPTSTNTRLSRMFQQLGAWTLLVSGILLIAYAGFTYGYPLVTQLILHQNLSTVPSVPTQDADNAASTLAPQAESSAPEHDVNIAIGSPLFQLKIPKISLDAVVLYGADDRTLKKGPGLMVQSAMPNQPGKPNSVIAGHRELFFRRLAELLPGDNIWLIMGSDIQYYQVIDTRIIADDDFSIVEPQDQQMLTLLTCWPIKGVGPTDKRYIVIAKPIKPEPD